MCFRDRGVCACTGKAERTVLSAAHRSTTFFQLLVTRASKFTKVILSVDVRRLVFFFAFVFDALHRILSDQHTP